MASDDKIIIEFDGDIKALKAKLTKTKKEVKTLGKSVKTAFAKGVPIAAKVGAVAIAGIGAAIAGSIKEAAKFETIATQFEVLTGSASQAKETVAELQQFAAGTPFQFEGIAQATQQLLGFGFEADEIIPKLNQIGDVASAIGKPIEEVGFIFGQVAASGKLSGERLLQFQERAIPIGPAIAKTMGIAESSVKDMVSSGAVDFKTFEKAFASLSQEGGFAFGGMIKQSKTFEGLLSTISDNMSLTAATIGKEFLPVAKEVATVFLEWIKGFQNADGIIMTAVKAWGQALAGVIGTATSRNAADLDELADKIVEVNDKMIENQEKQEERLNSSNKRAVGFYKQKHGQYEKDQQAYANLLAEKTRLIEEYHAAEEQADALALEKAKEKEDARQQGIKEAAEKRKAAKLAARSEEQVELDAIMAEYEAAELEKKQEHQMALEKLEKDRLVNVYDAKRANALDDRKAEIKENNLFLKDQARHGKSMAKMRAFFRSEEVKGTMLMLDSLATLGESGNKELGAIAKAAGIARAIMNTSQGVTNALAQVPYPLNFAAAASVGAAGAVQIAKISSQKFADGGMYSGGMIGLDSLPAMLQQGEVVIPKKNFEEVIGSVRAQRAAEENAEESGAGTSVEVELSFKDSVGEFIEATILERRTLGIGAV